MSLATGSPPDAVPLSWQRAGLVLNAGLVAAALVTAVRLLAGGPFWRADFAAFYTGGAMVLEGRAGRLYDRDEQAACLERLVPERRGDQGLLAFVNPPHAALLLAPLALLPWRAAFVVWDLLLLGLLAVVLRHLARRTAGWTPTARAAAFAALLAFPPLLMTFQLGQWSLLVLACLLGFYAALKADRPWAAAAWLVLGTVKPQLVVIPAVTLVAARRWRVLAIAAGLFAAWGLATTAVLGWSCWPGFLDTVRHVSRQFGASGIDPLRMYNVRGLLTALLGGEPAIVNGLGTAATLAGIGAAFVVWREPWRPRTSDFERRAGFTLLIGLLTNPHLNPADALTFVAPALLFGGTLGGSSWRAFAVLAAAAPLLFLLDTFVQTWRPFVLFALGWAGWMAWELGRQQAAGTDPRFGFLLFRQHGADLESGGVARTPR